jgi:hypothetical protein
MVYIGVFTGSHVGGPPGLVKDMWTGAFLFAVPYVILRRSRRQSHAAAVLYAV